MTDVGVFQLCQALESINSENLKNNSQDPVKWLNIS